MACRLFGGSQAIIWTNVSLLWIGPFREQASVKFQYHENTTIFVQENVFENAVCKMLDTLSRPQYVNILATQWWMEPYYTKEAIVSAMAPRHGINARD